MIDSKVLETSKSPLYVDLDGSFIKSDLLFEALVQLLKRKPLLFLLIPFQLIKGRAYLKAWLARKVEINYRLLPINEPFYSYLKSQKSVGRKIILATASHRIWASGVAKQYPIFDEVLASDSQTNLKSKSKLNAISLRSDVFSYAGDSPADIPILEKADEKHILGGSKKLIKHFNGSDQLTVWESDNRTIKHWMSSLRLYQWVKNLLFFVPVVFANAYMDLEKMAQVAMGFFVFSLLASATYLLNDLLDLEADRQHPRKKSRTLASGTLSIKGGILSIVVLGTSSLLLSYLTNSQFQVLMCAYLVLTLFYSFELKRIAIMDVIALAVLYTLRIIGGAVLIEVDLSFWLLAFSMFIFFSLALMKRCSEIKTMTEQGRGDVRDRAYIVEDYTILQSIGIGSALMSLMMFTFYIDNNFPVDFYQTPQALWLVLPALGYWLFRMWFKTSRGEMHDDPIVYTFRDRGSFITFAFIAILILWSKNI